jgi:hypothetical protein
LLVAACAATQERGDALARRPGTADEVDALAGAIWSHVRAWEAGLAMPLPGASAWALSIERGFLRAERPNLGLRVRARGWRAPSVASPSRCERAARETLPTLVRLSDTERLIRRASTGPKAFDVSVELGLRETKAQGVEAVLLAFGADLRQCFALEIVSRRRGAHARRIASELLGVLASRLPSEVRVLTPAERVESSRPSGDY